MIHAALIGAAIAVGAIFVRDCVLVMSRWDIKKVGVFNLFTFLIFAVIGAVVGAASRALWILGS